MGQMNTSQARAINPVLTQVARGYTNQEFVGNRLFPIVPVAQRGGTIIQFGKEQFILRETRRSPGGSTAKANFQYEGALYALRQHALSGTVPIELMEDASAVPGIDLGKIAVNNTMEIIRLRLEVEQATLALNATNYGVNNKVTLSGTSQWSHASSKPAQDIRIGREAIRSLVGRYPNLLTLSASVYAGLQENPSILERFKYTSRDSVTTDMLANLFDVDEVVVGKAVYANPVTGDFSDVWGNDAVLSFSAPVSLASMGSPSAFYTYRLKNYPVVEKPYYDQDTRSWVYPTIDECSPVIAGADAAFLFKDAVA